jgi:CarD family transcriptional regulator
MANRRILAHFASSYSTFTSSRTSGKPRVQAELGDRRREGMTVVGWFRGKQGLPQNLVQLAAAPVDDWGEPIWNEETEAQTRERGTDFLAPFLVEVSAGMCMGGYLAKAQFRSPVRIYDATAVLLTRKNDELQTVVSIAAPPCHNDGLQWPPYTQRHSASLPKEHVQNMVHTLRGLCEQAHAQELLKASSRPVIPPNAPEKIEPARAVRQLNGFAVNQFVVYPAHGVGQILAIEHQTIAGAKLDVFVINFAHDKMTLRVPTAKVANIGMRKISSPSRIGAALSSLNGSDEAQKDQAALFVERINSGDIMELARVVHELRPSGSREGMYKVALARLTQEIAVARGVSDAEAANEIENYLSAPT